MPGQNFLFVPGPTNVPERIMRAMVGGMEDHRSSRFPELTLSLLSVLKRLFKTESGQPFIFSATGTGACTRGFFDFADMIKANADGYFPYTPPLSLLYGLRESLNMLFEEGLDAVFARHKCLAEGVRTAVQAWKLEFCAREPRLRSDTGCVAAFIVGVSLNQAVVGAAPSPRLTM